MITVTYGDRPPCIVMTIPHREPLIVRDQLVMWTLINDLCVAYQRVFEERKPKEEPHGD